ncbi:hypothetical protein Pint_19557 [Pistacia integerrima]|uniref:Uncharacterized protein n=1 Tax=Pistacia integerrima TaxID=434235 RepID=A0ACC0XD46_9ROSI|nr:hypothetical protein Pint_19557 [Pistacia integerrima]
MVEDNLEVKTVNCGYFQWKTTADLLFYKEAIFLRTHYYAGHKHGVYIPCSFLCMALVWKIPPRIQGVEPDFFIQRLLQQTCDKLVGAFKEYVSMARIGTVLVYWYNVMAQM